MVAIPDRLSRAASLRITCNARASSIANRIDFISPPALIAHKFGSAHPLHSARSPPGRCQLGTGKTSTALLSGASRNLHTARNLEMDPMGFCWFGSSNQPQAPGLMLGRERGENIVRHRIRLPSWARSFPFKGRTLSFFVFFLKI